MTMERENSQNCYLNVRTDSENDLDALFNVVQSASKTIASEPSSNSLPMKMRNLPPSFFKQPARLDGNKLSPDDNTGLKISHSRAHSSPASLSIPTSSAGPGMYSMHQPTHTRTQSYDGAAFEESSQLPPGWEMRTSPSGQPYFMNHYEQVTTWQDPRKTQSTTNLTNSPTLPDGWEQAITPEGEIYYINHLARSTSWVDPRVAMGPGCRSNQQLSQGRGPPPPHKAMLERVQLEQEQLKKRQQELLKQEILLKHGLLEDGGTKSLLGNLAREASLGQLVTKPESTATTNGHIRDESFDSGLGMNTGGYNNYNNTDLDLNTANDTPMFDANYNTKDSSSCHPGGSRSSGRLPDFFDNLPGTNVDFGTIEDSDSTPSAMDTDDLGVGLDLPTDMLNDVESVLTPNLNTKITDPNFLTWL